MNKCSVYFSNQVKYLMSVRGSINLNGYPVNAGILGQVNLQRLEIVSGRIIDGTLVIENGTLFFNGGRFPLLTRGRASVSGLNITFGMDGLLVRGNACVLSQCINVNERIPYTSTFTMESVQSQLSDIRVGYRAHLNYH